MSVQLNLIEDATVRQDANGLFATRRALIRGVRGPADERPRRALEATGLPRYGDPHPAWGELKLSDIQLTPVDAETWEARLSYREPSAGDLVNMVAPGSVIDRNWFALTVTEELVQDINGERLYHFYTGSPLTPTIIGNGVVFQRTANQLVWKNERAEVQRPSIGVRVTISDIRTIERLLEFAGTVNEGTWSGYPAQTWLIGGMDSRREGNRWINTIEFFYRPETWKFKSVLEYFGAPPDDATEGNGIEFFDVYRAKNFNRLGFGL